MFYKEHPSGEVKMMGSRQHIQHGVCPRYSLLFPNRANVAVEISTHIIRLVLTPGTSEFMTSLRCFFKV
jgi:hypothetical protein